MNMWPFRRTKKKKMTDAGVPGNAAYPHITHYYAFSGYYFKDAWDAFEFADTNKDLVGDGVQRRTGIVIGDKVYGSRYGVSEVIFHDPK